jgi:hypothetical protein
VAVLWLAAVATPRGCVAGADAAESRSFRVHTSVTVHTSVAGHTSVAVAEEGQPILSNLTIFHEHLIYDFPLDASQQASAFDRRREHFTLLDGRLRIQCQLSGQELMELSAAVALRDARRAHGPERPAAEPSFRVEYDAQSLRVQLEAETRDEKVTYVVVGQQPDKPWAVEAYRQFADWFARLNVTRDGRSPLTRLRLNELLCDHGLLPRTVSRRAAGQPTYVGQHQFDWALRPDDLERIGDVRQWADAFPRVSLVEFRRRQAEASAANTPR